MKHFLRAFLIMTLIVGSALSASAQKPGDKKHSQWIKEMNQAKLEFMINQLNIREDQKEKFTEIYNDMQDEINKLRKETISLKKTISAKKNATDLEYEKAAEAMFEFKKKEGAIEYKYYEKLKSVLSPQQMFEYKTAEQTWMKRLMKHRKQK
ncbi:MAG: hypothetical protein NC230_04635 [Bacteroides sp.]|nr:hypothetical protein [Bacteroides sp.]